MERVLGPAGSITRIPSPEHGVGARRSRRSTPHSESVNWRTGTGCDGNPSTLGVLDCQTRLGRFRSVNGSPGNVYGVCERPAIQPVLVMRPRRDSYGMDSNLSRVWIALLSNMPPGSVAGLQLSVFRWPAPHRMRPQCFVLWGTAARHCGNDRLEPQAPGDW